MRAIEIYVRSVADAILEAKSTRGGYIPSAEEFVEIDQLTVKKHKTC